MLKRKYISAIAILSISMMVGCASTKNQESTGQYVDSSAITIKIKTKLLADERVNSLPITVETYKGRVVLSGFVDTVDQKHIADEIARHVDGVVSVTDALIVKNR